MLFSYILSLTQIRFFLLSYVPCAFYLFIATCGFSFCLAFISCVIEDSEGLLLICLVGMHSAVQASRTSAKEAQSTSIYLPAWLGMNLPRKSIIRDLNFVQSSLPKRCTSRDFCLWVVGFRRPSVTITSWSPRPGTKVGFVERNRPKVLPWRIGFVTIWHRPKSLILSRKKSCQEIAKAKYHYKRFSSA